MKNITSIILFLFISALLVAGSYAQPTIPTGDIPPNMNGDIRTTVEGLYSVNKEDQEKAADALYTMLLLKEKTAEPAAPFLIDYLVEELQHGYERDAVGNLAILHLYRGYTIDARAVAPLLDALKDPDMNTRANAAAALGGTGDLRAVEPLINALGDPLLNARDNAARSLTEITGKDFGIDRAQWQQWWERNKGN